MNDFILVTLNKVPKSFYINGINIKEHIILKNFSIKRVIKKLLLSKNVRIILFINDYHKDIFYNSLIFSFILTFKRILIYTDAKKLEEVGVGYKIKVLSNIITSTLINIYTFINNFNPRPKIIKKNVKKIQPKTKMLYIYSQISIGDTIGGSYTHVKGVVDAFGKRLKLTFLDHGKFQNLNNLYDRKFFFTDKFSFSFPRSINDFTLNHYLLKNIINDLDLENFDFIYHRMTHLHTLSAQISNMFNVPLIIEYNGSPSWVKSWGQKKEFLQSFFNNTEMYILNSADYIITVSEELKKELIQKKINPSKILFYPNGVNLEEYDYLKLSVNKKNEFRIRNNISVNDFVITFIGTFGIWHGVDFYSDVIIKLVQYHRDFLIKNNIKFLLIGDGKEYNKIYQKFEEHSCFQFVVMTGYVDSSLAKKYLNISDTFISPHTKNPNKEFFGSPTKLFEYMAYKKPIIASSLNQIKDIFQKGLNISELGITNLNDYKNYNSILFKPNNSEELIKAIFFVIDNKLWINKIGENSYSLLKENYTWDIHVSKIINHVNSNQF